MNTQVSSFSFPTQVIDGESFSLDSYNNMGILDEVAPGSKIDRTLEVDSRLFDEGGRISGRLMGMDCGIDNYEIQISRK